MRATTSLVLVPAMLLTFSAGPAATQPNVVGSWAGPYPWPDVAIHLHLLPDGKVLSFSDDDHEEYPINGKRLEGNTRAFVVEVPIDQAPGAVIDIPNTTTNLFCSGHAFLPDGRLLVAGGHKGQDGLGDTETNTLEYRNNYVWHPESNMASGRWYPTCTSLANGEILVLSGTSSPGVVNALPEVWETNSGGGWRSLSNAVFTPSLYPFIHVAPNGKVFMSGSQQTTRYLDTSGDGQWTTVASRKVGSRDYGSAVMYDDGKVLTAGGGDPPRSSAETIDLNAGNPRWTSVGQMANARRQMNLTILADGKVLATGGTSSSGFNSASGAVYAAEMWDPATPGSWITMASMTVPRLYHSAAILLPDGRVLSAGGGRPAASGEPAGTEHEDCEIFSPPYLFNGPRPVLLTAPSFVVLGQSFTIETPDAAGITMVNLIKLSSCTHAFNQGQRINKLTFAQIPGGLLATVPESALCQPGYYMLFILNVNGVPSVAKIIRVQEPTSTLDVGPNPAGDFRSFLSLRSGNPSRSRGARIAFGIAKTELIELGIYDITGRLVKMLAVGMFQGGVEHVVPWDGTNEAGRNVSQGVYFYRLRSPSFTSQAKLALLQP